tara:strand:+ start:524 stop:1579 length:1056 start_codon:yes stop_codon:yes gene_type:complete
MNRILVTGGAGFIGSHTCLLLLDKGYELIVIDSFVNSNPESLKRVSEICKLKEKSIESNLQVFNVDLRDKQKLEDIFKYYQDQEKNIEAVIHFAGLKSVSESISSPLYYWDMNVNSTINLLDIMDKYECRNIVFSSSATIYEASNKYLINEKDNLNPINPYGTNKVAIEQLLTDLYNSSSNKWRIANLRYFNPIGAHESSLIGEAPVGVPNNLFPLITQVAIGIKKELTIFGNDWPTPDGTGVRDYLHVMDLAEGHIKALKYLLENNSQIININLGTGNGTSVLELLNTFQQVNNIDIPYVFMERRKGDLARVVADNSLAISLLKWNPKMSLEKMCIDGWKWQIQNPRGYL